MGLIRVPWSIQPPEGTPIDWTNPLCRGLSHLSVGHSTVDLVTGRIGTLVGTVDKTVGASGRCLRTAYGAANRVDFTHKLDTGSSEYSYGSVFTQVFPSTFQYLIMRELAGINGGVNNLLFSLQSSSLNPRVQISFGSAGLFEGNIIVTSGAWHSASASTPPNGSVSASLASVWLDGIKNAPASAVDGGTVQPAATTTLYLNGRTIDNNRQLNGAQALRAEWRRVLSDAEHKSFAANPWQLLAPLYRRTPTGVSISSISRPSSDVLTSGWTGNPDNTNLYANIDESIASDTDFIISPFIAGGEYTTFGITPSMPAGTWDVRYRADYLSASSQVRIHLLDGSNTVQGSSSWQTVTGTPVLYTASITTTGTATRVKIEVQ